MAYDQESSVVIADPVPQDQIKDKWSDDYAKKIVLADFGQAESYRTHAHDWRYRNADELFLAWVGQRYWEGTRVPRSSLGIPLVYSQVESMLAKLVKPCASTDSYHFVADGEDDSLIGYAWRDLVLDQLTEVKFRLHLRRGLKNFTNYGNIVLEVGVEDWPYEFVTVKKLNTVEESATVMHPVAGPIPVPTKTGTKYKRVITTETHKRPYVRYVSMKDFYVDPNCESPSLQDAGYVIKRLYMRARQIKNLASNKDFTIPSDAELAQFSQAKATANQDVTKQSAELFRYNLWNPSLDYSADPANKRIEVIEYTSKERKVWMIGRETVIYNKPNEYGEINYFSVPYSDVPDRWHGLAVSDVIEGEQRLQTSVINARIDELALAIHPPTIKRRGVTIPAYQLRRKPGQVMETESPKEDIVQSEILNVTQQAVFEVDASGRRAQATTGITDLTSYGTSSTGGNSANRTAAGINTQSSATQDRLLYLVENIESELIEPVLNAVVRYNKKFMDLKRAETWLKLSPKYSKLDPEEVMNAKVFVECRGAVKMQARMGFLQVFPMLAQTILNPELLQLVAKVNKKKLNPLTVVDMVMDAINYSAKKPLFDDMTQDDIKEMQQPPPEAQMQMQVQQAQMQSDQQINTDRLKAKMFDTFLKGILKLHGDAAQLDDAHLHKILELGITANSGGGGEGGKGEAGD